MITRIMGFLAPGIIYSSILILHLILPARKVIGYVTDETSGKRLRYRLNGFLVILVALAAWAVLGATDIVPFEWLYRNRQLNRTRVNKII